MAQINLGHVVGQGVPSGGTAGQILKKNGSTNFDTSWATLDGSMVPVSAGDSTTVQQSLAAVKSDMGIVEDGNTATHTIEAGQYVIWKGALYTASAAIPAGTTLSTSNLTAVSGGGLNALNGNLLPLIGNTSWVEWTKISHSTGQDWGTGSYFTKIGKITYVLVRVSGLTPETNTEIGTIPSGSRPLTNVEFMGSGGNAYLNLAHIRIGDDGKIYVYSQDAYATGFISYPSR